MSVVRLREMGEAAVGRGRLMAKQAPGNLVTPGTA